MAVVVAAARAAVPAAAVDLSLKFFKYPCAEMYGGIFFAL
jgi:hypothetical protein